MHGYFGKRRLAGLLLTVVVIGLLCGYFRQQSDALQRPSYTSGYFLFTGVLLLASFSLRKKLSFLPLGAAATWMQLHIYASYVVIALFFMHVPLRLPTGVLETFLYVLFVLTCVSGLYGLTITRQLPKRISKLREEILFERIPALREEVASRAQRVMTELLRRNDAPALADYYSAELIPYFVQPRGALFAVRPTSRRRNRLHAQLDELDRYESSAERTAAQQLRQLIDKRDDLDYHQAQQRKLKVWLFAHIGLTAVLLMAASLHVVLAHAFWGGLP